MVMTRGKVGLYSNAMAAQAIKPKKAVGRSQRTRRWSKNFGLLANFVFLLSSFLSYICPLTAVAVVSALGGLVKVNFGPI